MKKCILAMMIAVMVLVLTAHGEMDDRKVKGIYQERLETAVIAETNVERARHGLPALIISEELNRAADLRALEIAGQFSHTRPDGTRWNTVSAAAISENIARGHNTPDRVIAAWMTSDGHRRNILRKSVGSIGVSAYSVDGVVHWVQLFGR